MKKEEGTSDETIRILLHVYTNQWNHLLHLHDTEWKCVITVGTITVGLMSLAHIIPKLAIALIIVASANIIMGVWVITRFRSDFLCKIMVLARIEKLLGLYGEYPQFADKKLFPSGWDITNKTFEDWLKKQMFSKKTRYFAFIFFFSLLTLSLVITSLLLLLP